MLNTFKYTVLSLIKERSILIWSIAFPLILATLFYMMFSNLDEALEFRPIPTAIVADAQYHDAETFVQMIDTLAEPGDDQILDLHLVKTVDEAKELLADGTVLGIYQVNSAGDLELFVTTETVIGGSDAFYQTILKDLLDNYMRTKASFEAIVEKNPLVMQDPQFLESLGTRASYTEEISVIASDASVATRYFYALLGFTSIMAANIATIAVTRTQANLSALGARRAVGATGRARTLMATILASWLLSFSCLLLAFAYMRLILDINFGRDLASIFGLLVASLMTTSLGAFIGSIPKLGEAVKTGILTGLSCFLGLFAGLYGTPSMRLADTAARTVPLFQKLNPARQVTDLFYSLYYYDGFEHFFTVVLTLFAIAAVLFLCAAVFMRRQRYASL